MGYLATTFIACCAILASSQISINLEENDQGAESKHVNPSNVVKKLNGNL